VRLQVVRALLGELDLGESVGVGGSMHGGAGVIADVGELVVDVRSDDLRRGRAVAIRAGYVDCSGSSELRRGEGQEGEGSQVPV
jgi:hypothetical protein